jgi:hypothetical protein
MQRKKDISCSYFIALVFHCLEKLKNAGAFYGNLGEELSGRLNKA